MADDDKKTEPTPLDKFKATMKSLINDTMDERDAAKKAAAEEKDTKTTTTTDTKTTTEQGGEKPATDWLTGLFGG